MSQINGQPPAGWQPDHAAGRHEGCGDAAAYALGALEDREARAFEAHLERCAACREELARLRRVTDVLPLSAPVYAAPPALRRRVLTQVRSEAASHGRGKPVKLERSEMQPGERGSVATVRRVHAGSWRRRGIPAAALALAACVAAVIVLAAGSGTGANPTHVYPATVGDAKVYLSQSRAELAVLHLAPAPRGRTYEVWLERRRGAYVPAGVLFGVSAAGGAEVRLPGHLRGVRAVLVSQEPAGGSPQPTSAPVIVTPLSS